MTLDEQIAQMTNPQEFARLCNAVFTDIYGDAFQVIDGTRGDGGNDGYVTTERRMLAMHCPIKPEQKTDAGYSEKIASDIGKAAALKRDKVYDIEAWTFITPRKLANDVIAKMRALGEAHGIRAVHQESTFLANELYRREHLLKGFPTLQQIDLAAKLDELMRVLANQREAQPAEAVDAGKRTQAVVDEAGDGRINLLLAGPPTAEGKAELKAIAFGTPDPVLEINAILALFRWFDPVDDDRDELLAFARRGVDVASRSGLISAEALFHAQIAALLVWDFCTLLVEARFAAIADILVSFVVTPIERTHQRLTRLRTLDEGWRSEVATAMDLSKGSRDYESVAGVLLVVGNMLGQLAQTHRLLGENTPAVRYLDECKAMLMAAKDVYATAGDDLGATNAVFNLANQVRWHDRKEEALALVEATIPVAEEHGDLLLLQKARWLKHTLETGEIPDYLAGERRAWTS
jgi:hypothetical protein